MSERTVNYLTFVSSMLTDILTLFCLLLCIVAWATSYECLALSSCLHRPL